MLMPDIESGWFKRKRSKVNSATATSPSAAPAKRRRGIGIMALEPRMMYDAATAASAAQTHPDVAADHAVVAAAADRPTVAVTSNTGTEPQVAAGTAHAVA